MAAGDAKAIPIKNAALRVTFPIYDADGDLVTGASSLDSEVSKDGAAFADCTNEATEIGATGIYTLDLTSTEMNADTVVVQVKTATAGAKTTVLVLYTAARSINDLAFPNTSGRGMDVDASGGVEVGAFQAGAITAAAFAAGAIDNAAIAADAIGASELAAGAATEIADAVWATAVPGSFGAGTAGKVVGDNVNATISSRATQTSVDTVDDFLDTEIADIRNRLPAALVGGRMDSSVGAMAADVVTAAAIATGAIDADAIAADAITAAKIATGAIDADALAADAGAEIADAVWDEAIAGHLGAGSTGAALNAAGSAGDPWSTPLPGAYGAGTAGKIIGDNIDAAVSSRASQTSVNTIDDFIDTEVAAILAAVDTEVAAIKAVTDLLPNAGALTTIQADLDNIQTRLPAALVGGRMDSDVGHLQDQVITNLAFEPDAIDAGVIANSTITAGKFDAGAITATAIAADALTAAKLAADACTEIADAILSRDLSAVEGVAAFRTLAGAASKLVNRVGVSGATLTVYKTDDTTSYATQTLTTNASQAPVTEANTD